jgi:hypothetical protein
MDDERIRVRCEKCSYNRYFRNARITAETRAANHALTKSHPVTLIYRGKINRIKSIVPRATMDVSIPF